MGEKKPKTINNLQLQCIKETLRLKKSTPSNFVWAETGLLPTSYMVQYRILCYWSSLVSVGVNKFSTKIYTALKQDVFPGWITNVKALLTDLQLSNYWDRQSVSSRPVFKKEVRKALYKKLEKCCTDSFTTNKCSIYKHLFEASEFGKPVWYVKHSVVSKTYRALASLRMRSHRLFVETGCWNTRQNAHVDFKDRTCTKCNILEDEYHFVVECELYNVIRAKYIPRDVFVRPNMFKFVDLLNSDDNRIINNVGNYIRKAYKIRQDFYNECD